MCVRSILAALAGVVLTGSVALSATLYSNFNTVQPEDYGLFDSTGPYISGANSYPGQVSHVANAFTLPAGPGITGYQLGSVQLGLSLLDGTNEAAVSVVTDENGLPDADHVLGSVTLTDQLSAYWSPTAVEATFASPLMLAAGQKYWLLVTPGKSDTAAIWHYNHSVELTWNPDWEWYDATDTWLVGDTAWYDGIVWQRTSHTDPMGPVAPADALGAFALEGSVVGVPEPALIGIVVGPSLCALWLRRRQA